MKILVISNLYPPHYVGGYELRCQQITEALRRRGHTLHVLTSNHGVNGAPGHGAPAAPPEAGVERTLRIHGFFGHPWLGIRALRALEFHNHRVVRDAIAWFRPDVVHVWNLGGLSKSICTTLERLGLPTVYDVSDHWIARSLAADVWIDWWNRRQHRPAARMLRLAWQVTGLRQRWDRVAPTRPAQEFRFSRIYFCSRALRELTAAKGYPVNHGAVIHCPVDTGRFDGLPAAASHRLRRWLYVGRLAEDKGVMTALRALAQLKARFPGELFIYGKGDPAYTAQLDAFIAANRLPVQLRSAPAAEMPAVYRQHDALLFTSEWEEPFALTPLEAMASGIPVIGTTTGGSRELLRHGDNALTYTAGDAAELAHRVVELSTDDARRVRLAASARAEVRSRYAEPVIVDQIESYLDESIQTWHPEPAVARVVVPLTATARGLA